MAPRWRIEEKESSIAGERLEDFSGKEMGGDAFENENGAANRCTIFLIWIGKYIWSIEISKYQKQVSSNWATDAAQWFEGDYLDKFVESRRSWVSWSQVSILLNDYQYMFSCAITYILITLSSLSSWSWYLRMACGLKLGWQGGHWAWKGSQWRAGCL